MLATIGVDANTGVARYTFGIPDILAGIDFLIVVIGLFGMAELLHLVEQQVRGNLSTLAIDKSFVTWADLAKTKWTILRCSLIGFVIGVLPGTGASVASAVAYGTEKRIAGSTGEHLRHGRHARPGGARGGEQRLGRRRHGADADARHPGLGHDGDPARRAADVQRHARAADVPASGPRSPGA